MSSSTSNFPELDGDIIEDVDSLYSPKGLQVGKIKARERKTEKELHPLGYQVSINGILP